MRIDLSRLSPVHQAFIARQRRAGDANRKPQEDKPTAFGEEFDSQLEIEFATLLEARFRRGEIDEWRYHPLRFRIAKNATYQPDFLERVGNRFTIWEVKGSWKAKNARDSRTRLEVAAYMYPWFSWKAALKGEDGWEFEEIHASDAEVMPMD